MSIAFVQQKFASIGSGTTQTITLDSLPTVGNMLILCTAMFYGSAVFTGVTGGGCTSWVRQEHVAGASNTRELEVWYGLNSNGSSAAIQTTQGPYGSGGTVANVSEWSGMPTSGTVIDGTTSRNTTLVSQVTQTISPTAGEELLVFGVAACGTSDTLTGATAGFTALNGSANNRFLPFYKIVSSTSGTYSFGFTGTGHGGGSIYLLACIALVGFKGAGGGGSTTPLIPTCGQLYPFQHEAALLYASTGRTNGQLFPL